MQSGFPQAYHGQASELIQSRLEGGGTVRFVVPTASMSPLLRQGDSVIVRGVPASRVRIGDLVVSPLGTVWRVHRLISLRDQGGETWITTKGDNTRCADEPCCISAWVGIVTAVSSARGNYGLTGSLASCIGQGIAMLSRWQSAAQARGMGRVALKLLDLAIYCADLGLRGLMSLARKPSLG